MKISNRVAELLAIKRRKDPEIRDLTLDEIAGRIGISRGALYNWMKNKATRKDDESILAFMQFFELTDVGDLIVLESEEHEESSPETETALAVAV